MDEISSGGPALADAFVERFVVEPAASGPLLGMSFAVKDLFDVAGRHTGCGNPTWRATHCAATCHSAVVQILLQAGARLVGKTRTDELAYSLDGSNVHEGAPINPAAPARLTGGSSSGAASAAAAGHIDFTVGTDTAGSVRVPAAWCGIFGMRPTHARVPVAGLTALAPSFDTVGWFARSAAMLHTVGMVLFGVSAVAVPSVALVRDPLVDRYVDEAVAAAMRTMSEGCVVRGLPVREVSLGINLAAAAQCLRVLQGSEAWSTHGRWIELARPRFGPGVFERFESARAVTADQVAKAADERAVIQARLDAALPPGRILCLPTVPGPAPRRDASLQQLQLRRAQLLPLTALASLTGRPQLTLPLPSGSGAPTGFSLLGWRNGDEALLEVARVLAPSC